jgi:hypothetical protein
MQSELSNLLGIQVRISVAQKAKEEPPYFYHLVFARSNPSWIKQLFELAGWDEHDESLPHSMPELGSKLIKSTVGWGISGFKNSDEKMFPRRCSACQSCPHLVSPPPRLAYHLGRKILVRHGNDDRICKLCGCFAYMKAKIFTEACPDRHPTLNGHTRWEERI